MLKQATDTVKPPRAESKPSINQAILIEKQSNQWKFLFQQRLKFHSWTHSNPHLEEERQARWFDRGREGASEKRKKTINQQ